LKWIGQHIVDFIARFRSDVYLDDISTGTIASGSNLGLDSNNKVVKATVSSGDITGVDLTAGEGITILDELNTDAGDYSATVGHGNTSSQSSVNNSGRTFVQDLTLDDFGHVTGITSAVDTDSQVGTVTNFTVTTDSGSAARYTSGTTPSISILGATGVGVTNSSGTITATAVPSEIDHDSLSNFVAAEHVDWAGASAGTIHSSNIGTLNQDTSGIAASATILEDSRTIGGIAFNGSANINLPGVNTAGNQNTSGTAAIATASTVVAANSTAGSHYMTFVDGATGTQGLETDTALSYVPQTNLLTAGGFVGAGGGLTGLDSSNITASTSNALGIGSIELGHVNDTTIARSASGVVTIESNIVQTKNKVIYMETANFTDDIDVTAHYIPFVTTSESPSFTNVVTPMIAPTAGKLLKVHYKSNQHHHTSSNQITFALDRVPAGSNWTTGNTATLGTKAIAGVNRVDEGTADFTTSITSGTNIFAAGDLIGVSMKNSVDLGLTAKYVVTLVFELDFNSY